MGLLAESIMSWEIIKRHELFESYHFRQRGRLLEEGGVEEPGWCPSRGGLATFGGYLTFKDVMSGSWDTWLTPSSSVSAWLCPRLGQDVLCWMLARDHAWEGNVRLFFFFLSDKLYLSMSCSQGSYIKNLIVWIFRSFRYWERGKCLPKN